MENTIQDFWRMLWEYEVFSIVMISSASERDMVSRDLFFDLILILLIFTKISSIDLVYLYVCFHNYNRKSTQYEIE